MNANFVRSQIGQKDIFSSDRIKKNDHVRLYLSINCPNVRITGYSLGRIIHRFVAPSTLKEQGVETRKREDIPSKEIWTSYLHKDQSRQYLNTINPILLNTFL